MRLIRRLALLSALLLLLLIGAAAALPLYAPALAGRYGASIRRAFWCRHNDQAALCLEGVTHSGVTIETAILRADRTVRLIRPAVAVSPALLARLSGADPAPADPAPADPAIPGLSVLPIRPAAVEVVELRATGLPIDLPPLTGTLLPVRALSGEGVEIQGDRATLTRDGPFGPLHITAERLPADTLTLQVSATCAPCAYGSEALGGTVTLDSVTVAGTLTRAGFSGAVRAGEIEVAVEATRPPPADPAAPASPAAPADPDDPADPAEPPALLLHFRLDRQPIAEIYALLRGIVPEAKKARIRGTLSGEGSATWPGLDLAFVPEIEGFTVDGLVSARYRSGTFTYEARFGPDDFRRRESGEGTEGWVPLTEIGPWLPAAVIAAEDGAFRSHRGYSIEGMLRAAAENEERDRIRQGGSTLTQQLAKNLFLSAERTYARKLRELLYAVELERELGKDRILELYLNIVEWGQDVHGAGPATEIYFLKGPAGLLPEEAAWMAGLLRHPERAWRTEYLAQAPDPRRVQHILKNMITLPPAEQEAALLRPVRLIPP